MWGFQLVDVMVKLGFPTFTLICALFEGDFYLDREGSIPDLDKPYLEHWSERLGLAALYREALDD